MKKTLLKALGAIFTIGALVIALSGIRQYCNIDPRFWFFVVLAVSVIGFISITLIFDAELKYLDKYIQTHSFTDFINELLKRVRTTYQKLKLMLEKLVNSQIYNLLNLIIPVAALTGFMYNTSFNEDIATSSMAYIVCLVLIGLTVIIKLLNAAYVNGNRRTYELISGSIWTFVFITSFTNFFM